MGGFGPVSLPVCACRQGWVGILERLLKHIAWDCPAPLEAACSYFGRLQAIYKERELPWLSNQLL
jgi:hypothetical protein